MIRSRYRRILFFFGKAILGVIFWDIILSHLGLRSISRRTRPERMRNLAYQFRILAIRMGGVMIKVGQFMSARLDVLPREITDELAGLQDEVTPEKFSDIRNELETSLGSPLESKFAWFEEIPMASASIGQAHRARLFLPDADGTPQSHTVVIKVQRPNIVNIVETDLAALTIVSRWLQRYRPISKHANIPALLEELSRSVHEEIDYLNEGRNVERFAENFKDDPYVRVPQVYWETTTRSVITLEDVQAIKITDYAAIENACIDRKDVAEKLLNVYLKQILEDRFFHADPHPGNLFVEPLGEEVKPGRPWRLVFVDFGMTGEISEEIMDGLKEAIIAIGTGDAVRLVRADRKLNFLLPNADLDLLERAYQRVFERFSGKSTQDMMKMHQTEAASFLRDFRDLIYDMPFQFPEDMILLGRGLSILSGMCNGLNPEFNFWTSLQPFTNKLIEMEGGRGIEFWLKEFVDILTVSISLPKKVDNLIRRIESGKLELSSPKLEQKLAQIERNQRHIVAAILFAGFLFVAAQLYLAHETVLAIVACACAVITLLGLVFLR